MKLLKHLKNRITCWWLGCSTFGRRSCSRCGSEFYIGNVIYDGAGTQLLRQLMKPWHWLTQPCLTCGRGTRFHHHTDDGFCTETCRQTYIPF